MQLSLDETFTESRKWRVLSKPAKCALEGLLQFATRRHCDWIVEGTAQELAEWVGPEANLSSDKIIDGLRELNDAGCITRSRCAFGRQTQFVVRAPVVER